MPDELNTYLAAYDEDDQDRTPSDFTTVTLAHARAEKAEVERDALALAIWDARGILGFDNDGDREPWAAIAGSGYFGLAAQHVAEAKQQRDDYEELLDLWDGTERKDWITRAEKAERERDELRAKVAALADKWEASTTWDEKPAAVDRGFGQALRAVLEGGR